MSRRGDRLKITVEVCDVCHNPDRPVQVWRIGSPGGQVRRVALCDEHAAPLASLPVGATSRRRGQRRVLSRDEVERG